MISGWQERKGNYSGDNVVDVLVDSGIRLADRISEKDHAPDPAKSSDDVVQEIPGILHSRSTGHGRAKSSNNGNESREDNRLSAVALIEFMSTGQMTFLEESGILTSE